MSPAVLAMVLVVSCTVLLACFAVGSRVFGEAVLRTIRAVIERHALLARLRKPFAMVEDIHRSMSAMLEHRAKFVAALLLSLFFVMVRVAFVYCLLAAIGAPVSFLLALSLVPTISLIVLLPISILGLGVKEGAFVFFFGGAGVPPALAVGASLASYVVIIMNSLVLGIVASFFGPALPAPTRSAEEVVSDGVGPTAVIDRPRWRSVRTSQPVSDLAC